MGLFNFKKSKRKRDLDTRKGLEDYVRVSFTRNHPMMFVEPLRNRKNVILEIIAKYNDGKSLENTQLVFDNLIDFFEELTVEEARAVREELEDQETLAIFDLLKDGKRVIVKKPRWDLLTTHVGRRTFATRAMEKRIPIHVIMEFTGHKNNCIFLKSM